MRECNYQQFSRDPFGAHRKVVDWVEPGTLILEVGTATGYMSQELSRKGCVVWGVEIDKEAARKAENFCQKVLVGDIEDKALLSKLQGQRFDTIILADVLEHLKDPQATFRNLTPHLKKNGKIIISTPNIAFLTQRLLLIFGKFDYMDTGIMDRTHLRFFTKKTILELVGSAGLSVRKFDYVGNFTQLPFYMHTLYPILHRYHRWRSMEYKLSGFWQEGLAVQFLLLCKMK